MVDAVSAVAGTHAPDRTSRGEAPEAGATVDDTAESAPDTASTLADELAKRAALLELVGREVERVGDLRTARMQAEFNASEAERAELLREMNALRDMAMEQMKKDDEILKKFIALI